MLCGSCFRIQGDCCPREKAKGGVTYVVSLNSGMIDFHSRSCLLALLAIPEVGSILTQITLIATLPANPMLLTHETSRNDVQKMCRQWHVLVDQQDCSDRPRDGLDLNPHASA